MYRDDTVFKLLRAHPGHLVFICMFVLNRIGYPNAYQLDSYYALVYKKAQA